MIVTFSPREAAAIRLAASISGYHDPLEYVRSIVTAAVDDVMDESLPVIMVEQPVRGRDILPINRAE